jgi:uncharacterized protein (TIRG00374 family)
MERKFWQITKLVISILVLTILIRYVGLQEIIHVMSSFNPIYLLILFLLHLCALTLGAVNIQLLLRSIKKDISFGEMFKKYLSSSVMGDFTPGRVGDFSLIFFLKKKDIQPGTSVAILLVDKILTVTTLLLISIAGVFLFVGKEAAITILSLFLLGIVLAWFFLVAEAGRNLIRRLLPQQINEKLKGFSKTLILLMNKKRYMIYNILVTVIKWSVQYLVFYVTASAFGEHLPLLSILLFATVMLISYIPITFGGFGLRETAAVFFFKFIGSKPELIISVFLVMSIIKYLVSLGIIFILLNRKSEKQAQRS